MKKVYSCVFSGNSEMLLLITQNVVAMPYKCKRLLKYFLKIFLIINSVMFLDFHYRSCYLFKNMQLNQYVTFIKVLNEKWLPVHVIINTHGFELSFQIVSNGSNFLKKN